MSLLLQREIDFLKAEILSLGGMAEENLWRAVRAVAERDTDLAAETLAADEDVDRAEVAIEEECLKVLALHQPVANDLRFIVAMLKINNDLERVGDMAVNIAQSALAIAEHPRPPIEIDFSEMAEKTLSMLKRSLDALVNWDIGLARRVRSDDDEVDELDREMGERIERAIEERRGGVEPLLHYLSISRHLERAADLAGNIAADVIYMAEGEIVRHGRDRG